MLKRKYLPPEVDTWPNFALESQGETAIPHGGPAQWAKLNGASKLVLLPASHLTNLRGGETWIETGLVHWAI